MIPPLLVDPYAHLELDTFDCPAPVGFGTGLDPRTPRNWHGQPKLSPDGSRLLLLAAGGAEVRVLDVRSGTQQIIDLQSRLPDVRVRGFGSAHWCPYDDSRVLLHCVTDIDTTGDGRFDVAGTNAYVVSLIGSDVTRITPGMFGPHASNFGFGVLAWLMGSVQGRDSIHMGGRGVYLPQDDVFVSDIRITPLYVESRDGHSFGFYREAYVDSIFFSVDGRRLVLPFAVRRLAYASWSPDGTRLALSVQRVVDRDSVSAGNYDNLWEQVWIVDVDRWQRENLAVAPTTVIHMQKRFCTYSINGIYAEFITNRTLAVSMYRDGDNISPLWEITDDGRRVRQLTF